jgi:hypothetical protein
MPIHTIRVNGHEITVGFEFITPEMAKRYLARGVPGERKIRKNRVEALAADMKAGCFFPIQSGIGFDVHGRRIDGQHRLAAIVQSGVGQWMVVERNQPSEWREVMDSGLKRALHDVTSEDWITTHSQATARQMLTIQKNGQHVLAAMSNGAVLEFMRTHREAIIFAGVQSAGPILTRGPRAAIAVAYYHVDRDILAQFRQAVIDHFHEDAVRGALIAKYIKSIVDGPGTSGDEAARLGYLRTQRVIKAFVEREHLGKIFTPSQPVYTLPEAPAV